MIHEALDRFPLASSKMMFSCCKPNAFQPHFDWFKDKIAPIIEGMYSDKPRQTNQQKRVIKNRKEIEAAEAAIETALNERDKLNATAELERLKSEQKELIRA